MRTPPSAKLKAHMKKQAIGNRENKITKELARYGILNITGDSYG